MKSSADPLSSAPRSTGSGASATGARRRGRPAGQAFFSPEEVAEVCAVAVDLVLRVLTDEKWRKAVFPGAKRDGLAVEAPWLIPGKDVRGLVGGPFDPPPLRSVPEFAELLGWPPKTMYELVQRGVVRSRMVLGKLRVPVSEYWTVSALRPVVSDDGAGVKSARALSFFGSRKRGLQMAGDGPEVAGV